jgi:hypothetical protein
MAMAAMSTTADATIAADDCHGEALVESTAEVLAASHRRYLLAVHRASGMPIRAPLPTLDEASYIWVVNVARRELWGGFPWLQPF